MSKINKGMEVSKHITLETKMVVKIHLTYIPFLNFQYCLKLIKKHVMQLGKFEHSSNLNNLNIILCVSLQGLHPNVTFPRESQARVPKLGLLLSPNFGCSYLYQIKLVLRKRGKYLIAFKNIFPIMYSTPQLNFI